MTRTSSRGELAGLLSKAVGDQKAREVVDQTVEGLGSPAEPFDRATALSVLETIAGGEGILAITARFVRSRLMLSWPEEREG